MIAFANKYSPSSEAEELISVYSNVSWEIAFLSLVSNNDSSSSSADNRLGGGDVGTEVSPLISASWSSVASPSTLLTVWYISTSLLSSSVSVPSESALRLDISASDQSWSGSSVAGGSTAAIRLGLREPWFESANGLTPSLSNNSGGGAIRTSSRYLSILSRTYEECTSSSVSPSDDSNEKNDLLTPCIAMSVSEGAVANWYELLLAVVSISVSVTLESSSVHESEDMNPLPSPFPLMLLAPGRRVSVLPLLLSLLSALNRASRSFSCRMSISSHLVLRSLG